MIVGWCLVVGGKRKGEYTLQRGATTRPSFEYIKGRTGTFVLGWRYGSERARRAWPGLKWVQSLRKLLNYNGARVAIAT